MNFNIGDRVKHWEDERYGTIRSTQTDGNHDEYTVRWDDGEVDAHWSASALIPVSESVNHPDHYGGDTTYEAIKVIEAWGLGFSLGNLVKYVARAGKKDPAKELEDLKKARFYLERHIKNLEDNK